MLNWLSTNQEWVFSGVGVVIIAGVFAVIRHLISSKAHSPTSTTINITNTNTSTPEDKPTPCADTEELGEEEAEILKAKTHLLFIDDDQKFRVVDILKRAGWTHTSRISDVTSIDDDRVKLSHIFFVDIQGVGKRLGFRDEGLGLALAIKDRYPEKKVVIYSAHRQGERFHEALRKADDFLAKDADPYEFQQLAQQLANDYWISIS